MCNNCAKNQPQLLSPNQPFPLQVNYTENSSDDDLLVVSRKKTKRRIIQSDSDAEDGDDIVDLGTETESDVGEVDFAANDSPGEEDNDTTFNNTAGVDSLFDDNAEAVAQMSEEDIAWEDLFKLWETGDDGVDPRNATQQPVNQGDAFQHLTETSAQVLREEWIPKTAARRVACEIGDLPELEQVNKLGIVF